MTGYFSPLPRCHVIDHHRGPVLAIAVARAPLLVQCYEASERKYFFRIGDSTLQIPEYLIADLNRSTRDWHSEVFLLETGDGHTSRCQGDPPRPHSPFVAIPEEEQAERLAALRRARDGYLLARHIVLWCAAGRHPTAIAAVLFCSRSSVYRTVRADQEGSRGWEHDAQGRLRPPVRPTVLLPMRQRSLLARLKAPPRAYGGVVRAGAVPRWP